MAMIFKRRSDNVPRETARTFGDRHRLRAYARHHIREATPSERALGVALRAEFGSDHVTFQLPIMAAGGSGFIADFAIKPDMIVVEVDGAYHREPEQVIKDQWRTEQLLALGWMVFRVRAEDVMEDADGCAREMTAVRLAYKRMCKPSLPVTRIKAFVGPFRMPGPKALDEHKPIRRLHTRR